MDKSEKDILTITVNVKTGETNIHTDSDIPKDSVIPILMSMLVSYLQAERNMTETEAAKALLMIFDGLHESLKSREREENGSAEHKG